MKRKYKVGDKIRLIGPDARGRYHGLQYFIRKRMIGMITQIGGHPDPGYMRGDFLFSGISTNYYFYEDMIEPEIRGRTGDVMFRVIQKNGEFTETTMPKSKFKKAKVADIVRHVMGRAMRCSGTNTLINVRGCTIMAAGDFNPGRKRR